MVVGIQFHWIIKIIKIKIIIKIGVISFHPWNDKTQFWKFSRYLS